jgi:hypothetical protein
MKIVKIKPNDRMKVKKEKSLFAEAHNKTLI